MSKSNSKQGSPLKQCLGIDVSKDKLDVCLSKLVDGQATKTQGTRSFSNTGSGWKLLVEWSKRFRKDADVPFSVVLEATGVYHEGLAYYLKEAGLDVSIVLPNKSKHFAKSLNIKTKNDQVDAAMLARMGLERKLDIWRGASPILLTIKRLMRERNALLEQKTVVGNQLHAHVRQYRPDRETTKRRQRLIAYLDKQAKAVETQVLALLASDADLNERVENICTIKGVRTLTALCVIAEADGFTLIENKNQLVSFAGYDVVERQSGSSLLGKTRISKKGNAHIRKALYFPALSAAAHDTKMKQLYQRLHEKNPKVKMIGAVAVQRKLLVLIYTLYKSNKPFESDFEEKRALAKAA